MKRSQRKGPVSVLSAEEAVRLIPSGVSLAICGMGGGIVEPTALIEALARRFRETREPHDLTFFVPSGLGDRADRGVSPLALPGLCRRAISGCWGQSPRLADMAEANEIEAYSFPLGITTKLLRAAASGEPGILTHIGLGTHLDPRQTGGRLNARTREELIRLIEIDGREWLFYPVTPIDVALIRGSTADTDGYLSMEDETAFLDVLPMAQAAHNNGGVVIAQVKRLVKARTLHPKMVKVPGHLVDAIVVVPDQEQLYCGSNRFMSGDFVAETGHSALSPLDVRKVIARRALLEIRPGDVGNVGIGISDGIGVIAQEEGVHEDFTLTVELGTVGGVSAQGMFFGSSVNMQAVIDMPSLFDFYDGGGLDIGFLSFAEVDQAGNVNVSRFNSKIMGVGGFVNISSTTGKMVFSGTLTAGGLKTAVENGGVQILQEGRFRKFLTHVGEISFNGRDASRRGQEVIYITERGVFRLAPGGLELFEIAPGMDPERDIAAHMEFRPLIAPDLREMDRRVFRPEPMGLRQEWHPG
ncbi:MAG: acetate CoA-transferase YdiF [Deltaproteobacteria bacterium]|nr:acetate CoA-transferase YdiF [Deltaproteobacteria bacterium]